MNYTCSTLPSHYTNDYFDMVNQDIIEWEIGKEGSEINGYFLSQL